LALYADCDADAVLAHVLPAGPACHTGAWGCFEAAPTLPALAAVIADRRDAAPQQSYTARLLGDRNLRLKKLGEETAELIAALADGDAAAAAEEAADLVYHTLVACAADGITLDRVLAVLAGRAPAGRPGRSGGPAAAARPPAGDQPVQAQQQDGAHDGDADG